MNNAKYYLESAKVSANGWKQQLSAAEVVRQVVASMVQVIAEADEYDKLGVKRAIVEDSMVVYSLPELTTALETLRTDHRGTKLASYYHDVASWFAVLRQCRSFKEWDECCSNFIRIRTYYHNCWASVVHNSSKFEAHFEQLAEQYRKDVSKLAAAKLPPVAISKVTRKDIVRNYVIKRTTIPYTAAGCGNETMYKLARYHHGREHRKSYGFDITFAIWARAIVVRAMYPRC